jgi:hypothetical protein
MCSKTWDQDSEGDWRGAEAGVLSTGPWLLVARCLLGMQRTLLATCTTDLLFDHRRVGQYLGLHRALHVTAIVDHLEPTTSEGPLMLDSRVSRCANQAAIAPEPGGYGPTTAQLDS